MQCSYLDCEEKRPFISKEDAIYCTQCYHTAYCSPDCRALDWVSHRKNVCNKTTETPEPNLQTSTSDVSMISQTSSMIQKKKKTLDDYEIIDQNNDTKPNLGRGTYSNVKLVREKGNYRKLCAMKILNKKQQKNTIKSEIKIQKKLNHPHVIKLLEYFEDKENVYLILEYAQKGTLGSYLKKKKKLPENEAFIFFFQTCVGLDYLHKKGVVHRDLKPDNLLLTDKGDIKLSDFGMSVEDVGERNSFCGTVDYMAPEIVQKKPHDYRVDIWSLGVLLYEMLHGFPPFIEKSIEETYDKIVKKIFSFGDISEDAKNLINTLLQSNPIDRINLLSVFSFPWMQKYEKEFKIDFTKYIYKPSGKSQNSLENSNSSSFESKTFNESSNLVSIQTPLISESILESNPLGKKNSFNPISNLGMSTPDTDAVQHNPNSTEKISTREETSINHLNLGRKTSPSYLTDLPNSPDTNTYSTRKSLGDRNVKTTNSNKQVDIDEYIQQYQIGETEEIKILNKLDNFYSTGLHKYPTESNQDHKNKPLDTKDPNRIASFFSNTNDEEKSRYSRQMKERNLEMSFQDKFGEYIEEENTESRVEETFGELKGDRESEPSLRKINNSIEEKNQKVDKIDNLKPTQNFIVDTDARKNYRATTNEKLNQENNRKKSFEHQRFSSIQEMNKPEKMFLTPDQRSSKMLAKSPKKRK